MAFCMSPSVSVRAFLQSIMPALVASLNSLTMAAVISNGGGYYSTFAYISEAKRMGLQVLGPDVNGSGIEYQGKDRTLRVGLMQLQGFPRDVAETIVRDRFDKGLFNSLDDFCRRPNFSAKWGFRQHLRRAQSAANALAVLW